jgi:sugar/nucleoside kinase (ribokinase family)
MLGAVEFLESAGHVTMLFANEEEALLLSGADDVKGAGAALRVAGDEVVITRGTNGAVVARGNDEWTQLSRNVEIVDTTGAGDAATGAYLSARLNGLDCDESLRLAMESASSVVGGLGSRG